MTKREKIHQLAKEINSIAILWSTDDIIERAKENYHTLTKEDAFIILSNLKKNHDCNYGITWETIDSETGLFIDKRIGV